MIVMNPVGYTVSPVKSLIEGKSRDLSGIEKSLIIKSSCLRAQLKSQAEFDLAKEIKIIAKGSLGI